MAACVRRPSEAESSVVSALEVELCREFDEARDLALLERLWVACHDAMGETAPAFERVSEKWTVFGFQQSDPVSDLRGGGVLALRNLVRFVEREPGFASVILRSRATSDDFDPQRKGFYPFCAAGVNITHVLADAAGSLKTGEAAAEISFWPLLAANDLAFDESYAIFFRLLDRLFDRLDASYMQFNAVLAEAKNVFLKALEDHEKRTSFKLKNHFGHNSSRQQEFFSGEHELLATRLNFAPPSWGSALEISAPRGRMEKLPTATAFGSRRLRTWRHRYFVLHKDTVAWFKPASETTWAKAEANGELASFASVVNASTLKPKKNDARAFKLDNVMSPKGHPSKLRLRASDPQQADTWKRALVLALRAAQDWGHDDLEVAQDPRRIITA